MNNETIDMNKLTQKELLILLNVKVEDLSSKLEKVTKEHTDLLIRVSNIETRCKVYSTVFSIASSISTTLIVTFLKLHF